MRQKRKRLVALVNSTLLGGVATILMLVFGDLTGARMPWWVSSMLGGCIGCGVSYFLLRTL